MTLDLLLENLNVTDLAYKNRHIPDVLENKICTS